MWTPDLSALSLLWYGVALGFVCACIRHDLVSVSIWPRCPCPCPVCKQSSSHYLICWLVRCVLPLWYRAVHMVMVTCCAIYLGSKGKYWKLGSTCCAGRQRVSNVVTGHTGRRNDVSDKRIMCLPSCLWCGPLSLIIACCSSYSVPRCCVFLARTRMGIWPALTWCAIKMMLLGSRVIGRYDQAPQPC